MLLDNTKDLNYFKKGWFLNVLSSPRSWGCFLSKLLILVNACVFPTLVGVFLCKMIAGGAQ